MLGDCVRLVDYMFQAPSREGSRVAFQCEACLSKVAINVF